MSDTGDRLLAYRPVILAGLQRALRSSGHAAEAAGWRADVKRRLQAYTANGKLLRGCLLCYTYELCGGRVSPLPDDVLKTAVALELLQAALLIHDDIIDQDELRRSQPAMHVQYRRLAARRSIRQPARFGDSMALCAGDMALFMAFEVLGSMASSAHSQQLMGMFADTLSDVAAGQMQDIYLSAREGRPAKKAIYEVMRLKTAAYSIARPLCAGALLANRPASLNRHLQAAGVALGVIFQIKDDELGVFGQAKRLGKPVGADIREDKKTLLYYYVWQAADPAERRQLRNLFGNPHLSTRQVESVRQMMRRYNVPAHLQADMARLAKEAAKHISQLDLPPEARQQLSRLGEFLEGRDH